MERGYVTDQESRKQLQLLHAIYGVLEPMDLHKTNL